MKSIAVVAKTLKELSMKHGLWQSTLAISFVVFVMGVAIRLPEIIHAIAELLR